MSRITDFNGLLQEAQQMLDSVREVISSTMQQGVEVIKNYEELANDKVSALTKEKKKELAEFTANGEKAKLCIEKKQNEFQKVEEKLKKELSVCYEKHYGSLDKILSEKFNIHEEAESIKIQLEQEMVKCISADKKTECFIGVLNTLRKRVKALTSRMSEIIKKETLARVKASKAVCECDKKAMDDAYKKCTAIINDVRKCTAANR